MATPLEPSANTRTRDRDRGGWLFAEFELGRRVVTEARVIESGDVEAFAKLSGDDNPLHLDEAFARGTTFRRRVAHGMLVESVASGLAYSSGIFDGTLVAIQRIEARFVAPVGLGDAIRMELEVLERDPEPSPRRGWVRLAANVYNQRDEQVIAGEWVVLMHRERPKARRRKDRAS